MAEFLRLLLRAHERRRVLSPDERLYRIVDGDADGMPNVVIDRFDSVALCHLFLGDGLDPMAERELRENAAEVASACGVSHLFLWKRGGDPRRTTAEGSEQLWGDPLSEFVVDDGVLRALIRPQSTPSAGLFLDMRSVRRRLQEGRAGHRVLNAFCFTGTLGLAAAVGGAREVVQLDNSKSVLGWAKRNHELTTAASGSAIRYIEDDALTFMKRELRRRERGAPPYDTIIIDPPAFGSMKGVVFSLKRDLPSLIDHALALLAPQGELIVCANLRELNPQLMQEEIERSAARYERHFSSCELLAPPSEDFLLQWAESPIMRGVWCR